MLSENVGAKHGATRRHSGCPPVTNPWDKRSHRDIYDSRRFDANLAVLESQRVLDVSEKPSVHALRVEYRSAPSCVALRLEGERSRSTSTGCSGLSFLTAQRQSARCGQSSAN